MNNYTLAQEKWQQAEGLLAQLNLDVWLIVVRETSVQTDPVLSLLGGFDVVWESHFLLHRGGERVAIVGRYDALPIENAGLFDRVIPYDEDLGPALREVLERWQPASIAVDYSPDNVVADGLTHGLWLALHDHLDGTPFAPRLVSADPLVSRLRAIKTPGERARLEAALRTAEQFWSELAAVLQPGLTELAVWEWTQQWLDQRGLACAWPCPYMPTVHAGAASPLGHTSAGDLVWEPGSLLHIDFGLVQHGFCTDQQRVFYAPRPGESQAPADLLAAFHAVVGAISAGAAALRPGVAGWAVDLAARNSLTSAGYPEYKHALGHTVGRAAHDGGALLGPRWPRYGNLPEQTIEPNMIFTLELGVATPYGYIGIEEEVVVTHTGCDYLSPPQTTPILIPPNP